MTQHVRPLVILESPYGTRINGTRCSPEEIEDNLRYLRGCGRDSIARGERPFASHRLYTHWLDDSDPYERGLGIILGWEFMHYASLVAVYCDRGITTGMKQGIARAREIGVPVEERFLRSAIEGEGAA